MKANLKRTFFSYVIPSVLSFALSGIYTIVDGFFVGQSMQDAGIAAVTIGFLFLHLFKLSVPVLA